MTKEIEILTKIHAEIKALRGELHSGLKREMISLNIDECDRDEALMILGETNPGYLTYYFKKKLLTRTPGGSAFLYNKKELRDLRQSIVSGAVLRPRARQLYD